MLPPGFEPGHLRSERSYSTSWITGAFVGVQSGTRTRNAHALNMRPLPLGYLDQVLARGFEPPDDTGFEPAALPFRHASLDALRG